MIRCLVPDLPQAQELLPWLARIDANRWYTNSGPLLREFEQRLATFIEGAQQDGCVAVSSGMSAVELGLRALRIGAGHRVLVPALTFPATALAVARCGAEPVLADVDPMSWTLTPAIARETLARMQLDAIVPVATYGAPLPVDAWDELAGDAGVPVLVDAAAALGLQRVGRRTHFAFSLHATKPLGVGEGGVLVAAQPGIAATVRRMANFGFDAGVVREGGGTNAKLNEYAAAVGLVQLQRWSHLLARRTEVFDEYKLGLAALPGVSLQGSIVAPPSVLCVRLPAGATAFAAALAQDGIETRRWYLPPLHRHPAFGGVRRLGPNGAAELPVTDRLDETLLGLPFHTRLSTDDVAAVVRSLATHLDQLVGRGAK